MSQLSVTSESAVDIALTKLHDRRGDWCRMSPADCAYLLDSVATGLQRVSEEWVGACLDAKGIEPESAVAGEEWIGLAIAFRQVRMLRQSLEDIQDGRHPQVPGPTGRSPRGLSMHEVFPRQRYDSFFLPGTTADVITVGAEDDSEGEDQARAYGSAPDEGAVVLALGAGNQACLCVGDILQKLFVERRVVAFKVNPVLDSLGPVVEDAFSEIVRWGALAIIHGGADAGQYMVNHDMVDELHMTGAARTYETIVFGAGKEGRARKNRGERLVNKPFTAELGNISPVILVPGAWSARDLRMQAERIAATVVHNAGFNCLTTHVLLTHEGWNLRSRFMENLCEVLRSVPLRRCWYLGAGQEHSDFMDAYPNALRIGDVDDERLPWTVIRNLSPDSEEMVFRREPFLPLVAEVVVPAESSREFLDRAVEFANERLWGTLTASILVDAGSQRRADVAAAVERGIDALRYGTVGVNAWGAEAYATGVTPWGAYPGSMPTDIQSGAGFVNNALMFERPCKTVMRGRFMTRVKPPELIRGFGRLGRRLASLEADPGWLRLAGVAWTALTGL